MFGCIFCASFFVFLAITFRYFSCSVCMGQCPREHKDHSEMYVQTSCLLSCKTKSWMEQNSKTHEPKYWNLKCDSILMFSTWHQLNVWHNYIKTLLLLIDDKWWEISIAPTRLQQHKSIWVNRQSFRKEIIKSGMNMEVGGQGGENKVKKI